jgi:alpha-mannosidase
LEYEVVDDGHELALTLLRSVGYLSRSEPGLRPNPAGPTVPVAGAQLPGPQRATYAVLVHHGDWRTGACYASADAFLVPFERVRAAGTATPVRPPTGTALVVDGAEVSAVLRTRAGLIVRIFRTDPDAGTVRVAYNGTPATGWTIDLKGRPVAAFEGTVPLQPWEICTLHLDEPPQPAAGSHER